MNTLFQRPDRVADPLYVVTPIFNPIRWRTRWTLFEDFARHCAAAGAHLHCIEAAFGNREFALGDHDALNEFGGRYSFHQVRTSHELWLKENLINLAVQRLPADWKYVAWVDADVKFARSDWANETVQQLQHYDFVQMYSNFQNVTDQYELINGSQSFLDFYLNGKSNIGVGGYHRIKGGDRGYHGVPGLAWACTRKAWDAVGGLIDYAILGSADWYMASALVGRLADILGNDLERGIHARYAARMYEWQERAERHIRRNVGVVKGLALHYWHGSKVNRKYGSRKKILIDCEYNPETDLKRDWQGVYQLSDQFTDRSQKLRDHVRKYFRERNEDA